VYDAKVLTALEYVSSRPRDVEIDDAETFA
jgi:hypothetical protein